MELQSKLLRVLQEGTFERVGDTHTRKVDVRTIAATNQDLEKRVSSGHFREDLYYRLNVFPITIAPLRERMEDIPALAANCIETSCRRLGVPIAKLTQRHVAMLQSYDWPGNVRELQNVIERAVITARSGVLQLDLPKPRRRESPSSSAAPDQRKEVLEYEQLKRIERENLIAALQQTQWRISGAGGAAELLGINASTLRSRLKAMGIEAARRSIYSKEADDGP